MTCGHPVLAVHGFLSLIVIGCILPAWAVGSPGEPGGDPHEPARWSVTAYSGVIIEIDMVKVPWNLDRTNHSFRLVALGVARDLGKWKPLRFEAEGQVATYVAGNTHWELNALLVARWLPLPWDRILDTSLAFGGGVSIADGVPRYENAHFTETSPVLAYALWEIDGFVPAWPHVGAVARLHHRSGLYGTFNGVYAGTNVVALGLKARF